MSARPNQRTPDDERLLPEETRALRRLWAILGEGRAEDADRAHANDQREYFSALRRAFRLYEDVVARQRATRPGGGRQSVGRLHKLAALAFDELGGQPEPGLHSLRDYDASTFGPYLGVSGGPTAAAVIRDAALSTPKARALACPSALEVGVAHDAERLGSIGELPVGPDEYRDIRLACVGRILTSTNVGARVNIRYYREPPLIWVNPGRTQEVLERALSEASEKVAPYLRTPNAEPRPVVVYVRFVRGVSRDLRLEVLQTLSRGFGSGEIGDPHLHSVGLLAKVRRGQEGVADAVRVFRLAEESNIRVVALEGVVRSAAEGMISMPGLLQYFNAREVSQLFERAHESRLTLTPKSTVDTDTVGRQLWPALSAARRMGLELGKYGLFPLTLRESDLVVEMIQRWFRAWSAAPALYVDVPLVGSRVFTPRNIAQGAREWLGMVARHNVALVLIDTVDKSKGRRLLKREEQDKQGILRLEEVAELTEYGRALGVEILWAGGIGIREAFDLGTLGVFGLYVTTAASVSQSVTPSQERDVSLAVEKMPTRHGVVRAKLAVEAGFLTKKLSESGFERKATSIRGAAEAAFDVMTNGGSAATPAERALASVLLNGWKAHFRAAGVPVAESAEKRGRSDERGR